MLISTDMEWNHQMGSGMGNQPSIVLGATQRKSLDNKFGHPAPGSRSGSAGWRDSLGNFYLFGGEGFDEHSTDQAHYLNDLWIFNSSTKSWHQEDPTDTGVTPSSHPNKRQVPKARKGAVMCGISGVLLLIFGGQSGPEEVLYDTWIYNIPMHSWLPLYAHHLHKEPVHPSARTAAHAWCLEDKIVIHGGAQSSSVILHDMWEFSLRNLTWQQIVVKADAQPPPRCGGSAWPGVNGYLYMFGGSTNPSSVIKKFRTYEASGFMNDMWQFKLKTHVWQSIMVNSALSPPPRQLCSHWTDNKIHLWLTHGQVKSSQQPHGELTQDTWMFDTRNHQWVNHSQNVDDPLNGSPLFNVLVPSPRLMPLVWTYNNLTFLFGGLGLDGRHKISFLNDLWMLQSRKSKVKALYSQYASFLERFTPGLVFLITMASTASVACVFGMVFCLRKTLEYPNRAPKSAYNVRYTPLREEMNFEYS